MFFQKKFLHIIFKDNIFSSYKIYVLKLVVVIIFDIRYSDKMIGVIYHIE